MSDKLESAILVLFRRLDEKQDRVLVDMTEIEQRLTSLEVQIRSLSGTESSHYVQTMLRVDGIYDRLDRIERRLDLVEV